MRLNINGLNSKGMPEERRLGICETCEDCPIEAGENAVVSFTVDDLDAACVFLKKEGGRIYWNCARSARPCKNAID